MRGRKRIEQEIQQWSNYGEGHGPDPMEVARIQTEVLLDIRDLVLEVRSILQGEEEEEKTQVIRVREPKG